LIADRFQAPRLIQEGRRDMRGGGYKHRSANLLFKVRGSSSRRSFDTALEHGAAAMMATEMTRTANPAVRTTDLIFGRKNRG